MITSLIAAISADGKIAQAPDQSSIDWTSKEDLAFFVSKTKEIGTMVMGRKTFDTIGKPLKGRRIIVMTRQHELPASMGGGEAGSVEFTNNDPRELVERLKQEGVEALAVCGGSGIYTQFLVDGLVDELFLTVEPVLFGHGVPLLSDGERVNLKLVDTKRIGDQAILLHYARR